MGFYVDTAEMKKALEQYQKLSKNAQEQLNTAKSAMNGIMNSNAMYGQVGQAIAADINNNKNAVIVGLKNSYKLVEADLQKTYADFLGTTGETSENAILDEATLTKAKGDIDKLKTEHQEKRQTIKSIYGDISDLISLSMPSSSSFTSACEESKKHLEKIIQKVNEFDSKQAASSSEEMIDVLSQQIKMSESASGLSYTDPTFMEFVSRTELAEAIKNIDTQITEAEKEAKLEADQAAKEAKANWSKHHPVESFLQNMSDSIGGWWGNVVSGTKNLSIPQGFKDILVFGEGFIGGAGQMVSSISIGAAGLIHLGVELGEWGLDSIRGVQTPQWKLDDIHGAWENTKAIGQTLSTLGAGLQVVSNPWLLLVSPYHRESLKESLDMGAGIVNTVINDIKTGNAYAIGGYVFDIASMFIGVGEVNAALKGTKLATVLSEGLNAFKATSKVATIGKLGKATALASKAMTFGDDALKALATKLKNVPFPVMDEVALAGGGSVKVFSKGTLDDYLKLAKSNFSKGSGAVDDVAKKASGAGNLKELNVGDFTDEIMRTKPKNSKVPDKWIKKGGKIEIDELGNWKYTNKSGKSVIYKDGYPDFNPYKHPNVDPVPIEIARPKNYPKDYEAANRAAGLGPHSKPPITDMKKPPEGYIWHHVEDGETMILVEKDIHREFTHAGGQSLINGKGK